jgi:class 3 adenylate cyclase
VPSVEEYERAGLYDPYSPTAADRLALLEFLAEHGLSVEEMTEGHLRRSLPAALADRTLRPGDRYTLAEVAERAGVTLEEAERMWRAVGFPAVDSTERIFAAADAGVLLAFKAAAGLLGEEAILDFSRVMGSSLARIAESAIWLFLSNVEAPLAEQNAGELALAQANLEAVTLLATVPQAMDAIFRFHVETAIRRSRVTRTTGSYDTSEMGVGFVDLVGFTTVSRQLSTGELSGLIHEFEGRAFDVVTAHDGRVVKLIGDEVMFVALDTPSLCEIALTLLEPFGDGDSAVTPRGGLAVGGLLTRGGDYFGPVVNVAARITDSAVPYEILVTTAVREQTEPVTPAFCFEPAGRRMLKGFDQPVELFSLTRA